MYLKSLILKGFKSFADRSVLSLEPGITAIVGPNGSGKSNIADAVLWVLGERNAKHLRGQAMEDVIFSGSADRKAAGLAEVDLVLDNSDGTLPIEFDEVAITRRMYRSGDSEYLINGSIVRRMDVLDILHDSGLGTSTYSIISQGALDSVLQSKPEDRRELIEEAAGVLKHKQRKIKSERKLAQMDQHLTRVHDVVNEVERQLGPLERRAKKAHTYLGLSNDLAEYNLQLAVDDLRQLQQALEAVNATEAELTTSFEEKKHAIDEQVVVVEELQQRIQHEGVDANELSRLHRQVAALAERLDSTVLVMRERQRAAVIRSSEIQLSLDEDQLQRSHADSDFQQAEISHNEAHKACEAARAHIDDLDRALKEAQERSGDLERELTTLEQDAQSFEDRIEALQHKHVQNQEALTNGLAHMKVLEAHRGELELQLTRAEADAATAADEAQTAQEAITALDEQEAAAKKTLDACLEAREATRVALDNARDTEHAIAVQIQALEEIERTSASSSGSARAWLMEQSDQLAGALEPLVQVIHARNGRETLVEALLGSDVSMLLIDDATCAEALANVLDRADQSGEVSLILREDDAHTLPDNGLASQYPSDAPGSPLINDLDYPESAARVVEALLGDVIVCETLDEALRAHADDTHSLRFVTPDGAVVWATGKVTIGRFVAEGEEGSFARARHIDELKSNLVEAQEATKRAQTEAENAQESLRDAQASSLDASQKLAALRGNADAAQTLASRAAEKLEALQRESEDIKAQQNEAQSAIDQARPQVEDYESQVADLQRQLDEVRQKQIETNTAVEPMRNDVQRLSEELTEAKLEAAKLEERDTYWSRTLNEHQSDLEQLAHQVKEESDLLTVKKTSAQRLESLFALFDELSLNAQQRMRDLEEQSSAAQDVSSELYEQADEARAALRQAHADYDEVNERLSTVRVEKGRLELQVDTARNTIVQDCGATLEQALAMPKLEDRSTCEEEVARLQQRIARLGTINPQAATEYGEIKERYDYLMGQLADLDAARKALTKINKVVDERMRDDFVRTFHEVNDAFCEVFSELFPGGTACLSLVDPDDIDNTGIEVNAQPAGKHIAKMSLMSGGEKSLTALALLFAVNQSRCVPFYILDEVEAALDDVNLQRLMNYIDRLRATTQLIMITHQRRTMEMADVLFGVSMQADGVTKVISQKLDRALQYAE